MKQIHKILVPVDFSGPSNRAVAVSMEWANKFAAELHLVHVHQLFVPSTLAFYHYDAPPSIDRDLRAAAQRALAECAQRVRAAGVAVHEHLLGGTPAPEVVELAERIGADLIVMGTQGLSGIQHALLGSVAEKTVRLARCPVITIGHAESFSAMDIHRILVPVDFSDHAQRALDEAIDFAKAFGAEVHLLHSYQIHPQAIAPYGIVVPETLDHDLRMAALQRLSEWRDKVTAAGCKGLEHITADFPVDAIQGMAERVQADLIVMGTRGLTGFKHVLLGSVAERTLRTAKCPVLTVKSGAPR
jgi:nucleotide-binding universal stress UspA family protein